ncbi:hypothetical protein [Micromonospora sp. NBC_01796]|uniref:hypothetical protein n=1 Tax=Micromonospora sp. NBC_01796 TaxID=2975987 RepID=UPI002DDB4FFF|nr:hypothetical protein [Micromonospora sp. NBC_01796]WSA87467.1 hypothetical protein OIE47_07605 [Micromonospora sp. NBC_01796]
MTEVPLRPDPPERMCPSTPKANATVFLGMITPAGRVAYVTPAMPAEVALSGLPDSTGPAESQYRLAGPCVTSSCGFWTGDHCGLGARLVESYRETAVPDESSLPRCAIRRTCRWYAEQGPAACPACSHVVTDAR